MNKSVSYWLEAEYKRQMPGIAQDANPAKVMAARLSKLLTQWRERFNEHAEITSSWFVRSTDKAVSSSVTHALNTAGMSVKMRNTPELKNVLAATYQTQVSLIKSIPEQYLTQVDLLVQESVSRGRDIAWLRDELQQRYGVTRRRAIMIARDQNNKATNAIAVERNIAVGVTEGIWEHHSGGSKTYRQSHVKAGNDKLKFDLRKGAYIGGQWIMPGELPNCNCTFRPVVPGFA
ncbi:phage minor head protein [Rouxiella badensis]|uniref:phage head morphogenesis protein n=1 Tax=Rouxiella badensis TaxID=1646377 RepID=UPI0022AAF29B|nr:phage minor head protein [Rouxiella badensis]WAT10141.1 phage minor head protein [Rouxiella badensis]